MLLVPIATALAGPAAFANDSLRPGGPPAVGGMHVYPSSKGALFFDDFAFDPAAG